MTKAHTKDEPVKGQDLIPVTANKEPVQKPEKSTEKLLEFTAVDYFQDGNLRSAFEQYGYASEWRSGEKRMIPKWLAQRALSSGARLLTKNGDELSLW